MNQIGDLSLSLFLDVKPLGESIKTSLNLLKMFKGSADSILKLGTPKFDSNAFDAEIKKLDSNLDAYRNSLKQTDTAQDAFGESTVRAKAKVVSFEDSFANAGLRIQGFQQILGVLKSSLGSLVTAYANQEIADAKLQNGLKNVGEGVAAFNKLTSQAGEMQFKTPFDDAEIENAQAMLTTFMKSSDEIEILTPRILDLAAAYMQSGDSSMSLQQISVLLGKVNEESIGQLRRVGVAFSKEQEEKLKSLKGTEQAIYLANILDQNFKGMAETVGNTAAGQMKIFGNQLDEVKKTLGKLLVEAVLPILKPIGSFLISLSEAPAPIKVLTLGIIVLAAAFVTLNTSMGAIPYVIIGIITAYASLNSMFKISTAELKANQDQMLKNQEVTKEMKTVLDEVKVSANNMAEAYDGLSASIIGMSKAQLESAKAFVEAEIIKNEAVLESIKVNEMQRIANLGDISTMEQEKRGELQKNMFKNFTDIGPNLQKLYDLKSQIESKMKFTPDAPVKPDFSGSSKGSDSAPDVEKEKDIVEEQIKAWNQLIKVYYSLKETKELLNETGKSEPEVIEDISRFIKENTELIDENSDSTETKTKLTKEQLLALDDYKQGLLATQDIEKNYIVNSNSIVERIKKIVEEERRLYNEMELRNPNRKLKPFDEYGITSSAIKLQKEMLGDKIKMNDLVELQVFIQDQLNTLNRENYKDTEKIIQLEKTRNELKAQIQQHYEFERLTNEKTYELKINLIKNEYEKRRQLIEWNYKKELDDFRASLKNKQLSQDEYNRLYLARKKVLDDKKSNDLDLLNKDKQQAFLDAMSKSVSAALQISQFLNIGGNTFISRLLSGLQSALSFVIQIKELLEAINTIKSITSLISLAVGGPAAIGGLGSGGPAMVGGLGGGGSIALPDFIRPPSAQRDAFRIIETPYIGTIKAKFGDIFVELQKAKAKLNRNTI